MYGGNSGGTRLATIEELIEANAQRAVIAASLAVQSIDHLALRRNVFAYVCGARDMGTPPGEVIVTLTTIVGASSVAPPAVRDSLTRSVILWCVDAYFGHIGERVGDAESVGVTVDNHRPLPPVRASNR